MPNRELLRTLQHLQDELAHAEPLDEETRASLAALTTDIQRLLNGDKPVEASGEPLPQRVQDLLLEFETEHPRLTLALNQVAGALANLGI